MRSNAVLKTTLVTLALAACVTVAHAGAVTRTNASCVSVPAGFSKPAVLGKTAPQSFWKGRRYGGHILLTTTPSAGLIDQPVTIRVDGLQPGEPVSLRASTTGYQKHTFVGEATFVANARGEVDVARQAPKYGSYSGVHAMGLVWSMQPQGVKHPEQTFFEPSAVNFPVEIEALADGRVLAKTTFMRNMQAPGVTKTEVHEDGLVGELFKPASPGPHPAVIVLGGSEGGLYPQVNEAALFASQGYVALGLAYFQGFTGGNDPRLASLPKMLVDIPLEYFVKAADWLKQQPGVDPHRVAIMGWSKGAEASLVTAATFPHAFQAVIAFMPSSVVWAGITYGQAKASSSWTLHGKPMVWLDYAKIDPSVFAKATTSGKSFSLDSLYRPVMKKTAAVAKAAIPVGRIAGPVLLVSAGDDQIWPSSVMAQQIMQRLAANHHAYADQSLCYADAGHGILPPWRPANATAAGPIAFGGDPVAYAFADQNAWNHVLEFLHASLGGKSHAEMAGK